MKNIAAQMVNFDREQMRRIANNMPEQYDEKPQVSHGAIWNNPPYSNIRPWVEKAAEQCIQQRQTVVMLVPEDMSVGWFSKALESVDEVRIITDGRINFIEPSTGLEKKGNSKGSMLLIWRPFISPRRMFTTVSKAALMAIGQGVRRAA
ncbi:phage N-6-adenine-methyltransferase [Shigella sonnei]